MDSSGLNSIRSHGKNTLELQGSASEREQYLSKVEKWVNDAPGENRRSLGSEVIEVYDDNNAELSLYFQFASQLPLLTPKVGYLGIANAG